MATRYLLVTASGPYTDAMNANIFDPACPTRQLLDRVGDKWTVLVVIALSEGRKRFGELRREVRGASAKVLTDVLHSRHHPGVKP